MSACETLLLARFAPLIVWVVVLVAIGLFWRLSA